MPTGITVPVGSIVRVILVNGTGLAVDVIARLQMDLTTISGTRMLGQFEDAQDPLVVFEDGDGGGDLFVPPTLPPPPAPGEGRLGDVDEGPFA